MIIQTYQLLIYFNHWLTHPSFLFYSKACDDQMKMAEIIGLVASTVTIAATVLQGVKFVKTCYRASNELETLQASDHLRLNAVIVSFDRTAKKMLMHSKTF